MFEDKIPSEVTTIIDLLYSHGYEAFLVGGCVRDLILGRVPKDWDISTQARPDTILELFDNTIPTGIKYGTITVILNDKSHEITTYRGNEIYTNHRQPDSVQFIDDLYKDLERRDFSMNAIAYNHKVGLVDMFGGINSINNRCITVIGDANSRFVEDSLRMLRAIRFSCELNFSIEENTVLAIKKNASLITSVSYERIYTELSKGLLSDYPERFILFHETGLLKFILPMLYTANSNTYKYLNTAVNRLSNSSKDIDIRLAILFCNWNSNIGSILKTLKLDNNSIRTISTIVNLKDFCFDNDPYTIKSLIKQIGSLTCFKLIKFKTCIDVNTDYSFVYQLYREIIDKKEPIFLSDLNITGVDIQNLGASGPLIGKILDELLNHCLKNPQDNVKSTLIKLAQNLPRTP